MERTTGLSVVVALAVVAATLPMGAALASGDRADVAIESVDVKPREPAPGDPFQVTATVANLASSNDSVTVTDVYVRERDSSTEYARVKDVGAVGPGNAITVPLSVRIDDPGSKQLRVHANVETGDGDTRSLSYPLLVTVEEPDEVLLSIDRAEATTDRRTPVGVTVANGARSPISSVQLTLGGNGTVPDPERITASIPAGVDRNFTFNVTFDEPGTRTLNADLTYTTANGTSRTVTQTSTVAVSNGSGGPTGVGGHIRLTGVSTSGGQFVTVQGNAANVGGSNAESVFLAVENTSSVDPVAPSGEFFVGAINASQFDTFELTANVDEGAESVPVNIQYIVDDEQRRQTVEVDLDDDGGGFQPPERREPTTPFGHDDPSGSTGGGGMGLLAIVPLGLVGLLVLGGLAGVVAFVRRR